MQQYLVKVKEKNGFSLNISLKKTIWNIFLNLLDS